MTLREWLLQASQHPQALSLYFGLLPALPLLLPVFHKSGFGGLGRWKYVYSTLTYLSCLPGLMALVLIGYALGFTHENLLDVNPLIYFLPVLSMGLTLALIRRQVDFRHLPGVERLSALCVLIGVTFGLALMLNRFFVGVIFHGGIGQLLLLAAALFLLLRWATRSLFRGPATP